MPIKLYHLCIFGSSHGFIVPNGDIACIANIDTMLIFSIFLYVLEESIEVFEVFFDLVGDFEIG